MKAYFYDILRRFIKSRLITKIFILLIFALDCFILTICFVKKDVVVSTPGVINNPSLSFEIESEEETKFIGTIGIYNYSKVSLLQYWLSKDNIKFTVEDINEDLYLDQKEELKQGMLMKDSSVVSAIIAAYKEASKLDENIKIENLDTLYKGVVVTAIYNHADTELKVGDVITKVNGESFNNYDEFRQLCSKFALEYDYLMFSVVDGDKTKDIYAKIITKDDKKSLGISVDDTYEAPKTTPECKIVENYKSIGPSGGAMTALSIYDRITDGDITRGKRIVGTGTIDINGNIGAVGGLNEKIVTAINYEVDIFFVGSYNYEEALASYNLHKATFDLVKVETFSDIIEYLNGLEG